ncbi:MULTISPECIES: hypothetical protein [unclassified Polaribacter]|uniref:hypothetical protein n=1 Tax=unclassified Polaribacter TaxID=196858 RepID=UPI0011BE00A5|nr:MULTISPECIES: hypothetical protein [unclassified Polaribacter]TXD51055.1 hypothetical protein ES043_13500 [Polaribacter sp. IC063]TXD57936.1 hypothetical protein ES044_13635 [Polaribacter sp. IC066]
MGLLNFNIVPSILHPKGNDMTDLIIKKAKEVGADAVLVIKFSNEMRQELAQDISSKKVVSENSSTVTVEVKLLKFNN